MGPIWGRQDPGGPMLAPWTLLSGVPLIAHFKQHIYQRLIKTLIQHLFYKSVAIYPFKRFTGCLIWYELARYWSSRQVKLIVTDVPAAKQTPDHQRSSHYNDVIMSTIASQITSLTIVYSTVYSGADQRKHQSSASLALNSPGTGEFPAQRASNAENVSIWWRHHDNW